MANSLKSKKLLSIISGVVSILIVCGLAYLDGGRSAGVFTTAITVIGTITGIHNWVQSRVDEVKEKKPNV